MFIYFSLFIILYRRHQFINIAQNVLWIILLNYLFNFLILNVFIVNVSCLSTNPRVSAFVPKLNNSYFHFDFVKLKLGYLISIQHVGSKQTAIKKQMFNRRRNKSLRIWSLGTGFIFSVVNLIGFPPGFWCHRAPLRHKSVYISAHSLLWAFLWPSFFSRHHIQIGALRPSIVLILSHDCNQSFFHWQT